MQPCGAARKVGGESQSRSAGRAAPPAGIVRPSVGGGLQGTAAGGQMSEEPRVTGGARRWTPDSVGRAEPIYRPTPAARHTTILDGLRAFRRHVRQLSISAALYQMIVAESVSRPIAVTRRAYQAL